MSGPRRAWRRQAVGALFILVTLALPALRAGAAAIAVTDDAGTVIMIFQPAQRIVSLSPHATELIYQVGAGSQLVGASDASDYPPAALDVTRVGGASGFDLEAIAALHPDLIVAWSSGNSRQQIDSLKRLGLAVFESDPKTIEEIATSLERLGQLTGHARQGQDAAQRVRSEIASLGIRPSARPPLRVFVQIWDQPLYTLGGPHLVSRLIEQCGGTNIFSDVTTLAPVVSAEAVLARRPELIVTDPEHLGAVRDAWIKRGLKHAGQPAAVVGIEGELLTRPSGRIVDGARALCHAIEAERETTPR